MTEAERSKYDGRDMVILNRHTEDTIQEDKLSFPMQMENHSAHVRMQRGDGESEPYLDRYGPNGSLLQSGGMAD